MYYDQPKIKILAIIKSFSLRPTIFQCPPRFLALRRQNKTYSVDVKINNLVRNVNRFLQCKLPFVGRFKKKLKKMGNCVSSDKKTTKEYPINLQVSEKNQSLRRECRKVINQIFALHSLQDVASVVMSLLDIEEDCAIYYRMTRPDLCDVNEDGRVRHDFYISPEWLSRRPRINILMFGPCSGKTRLVERFVNSKFEIEFDPTIEYSYWKEFQLNYEIKACVDIVDTGGYEQFSALFPSWISACDCIILAHQVVPVIVAGTQCDTRYDFSQHKAAFDEIIQLCKQYNFCYIETSAKDNINVDFLFQYSEDNPNLLSPFVAYFLSQFAVYIVNMQKIHCKKE
ncbi:hypothetical protein RFI_13953 [Reticulomyxa filosa]|uniref:Uncharacterized protein n=1 Tax=Reticulomyxa filosa TaxID=46433 RepID=X6NAA7_RETFI|nr:hypothetical protein RFI_13953 [Reticulomyxa filosa]|eukprot:ETO23230.1 hypothetical protein RFI_13953 [Reticulomyxa filosa]